MLQDDLALLRHVTDFMSDIAKWGQSGEESVILDQTFSLYPACDIEHEQAFWKSHQEQVIDAGTRVFEGQAGIGVPQGLARFCSGPVWAEATLLSSLYQAACSRAVEGQTCSLFVVHLHQSYLDEISERLTTEGVPHTTAVGTLDDVGAILSAARAAGIPDFEEHLWLGSLLETFYLMRHERRATAGPAAVAQTPQGIEEELDAHAASWAKLVGDRYGLVTVDMPDLAPRAQFPATALNPLLRAWRSLRGQPPVPAAAILSAAARAGLVPRPDSSIRFSRSQAALMLTHLVKVPLTLRPAALTDGIMEEAQLVECLNMHPRLSAVADFSGDVVAALTAHPSQGDAAAVELAFVHVGRDLEEQQELLECLLAFVLQFLLADDTVTCLLPGGLPLAARHPRIAEFHYVEFPDDSSAIREIRFGPGLNFDALVRGILEGVPGAAAVAEGVPGAAARGTSGATFGAGREDAAGADADARLEEAEGDAEIESGDVAALPSEGTEGEDPAATAVRAVVLEYLALAHGGEPPADFGDDTPFMEAGLDSLDLLKLASLLGNELGMALPSTLAFDFPTVAAIAAFVATPPEAEQDVGARERRRSSFSHLFSLGGPASLTDVFRRSSFAAGPPSSGRRRTGSVFRGSGGPSALAPLVSGVPSDFSAASAAPDESGRPRSRSSIGRPLVTEGRLSAAAMLRHESVAEEGGQGRRRSTARRRSSSAFMHAHMAMIPAGGRRGSVLLGSSGMGTALMAPTPALQVVVMDALAVRLAAGSARSVGVFGEDMPRVVPLQRWDTDNAAVSRLDGRLPSRFAAFMEGVDCFDAELFRISGAEAAAMDAQQRLLLEASHEVIGAAAGPELKPKAAASASAAGDSPGVFVGISYNEYAQLSAAAAPSVSTYTATGGSLSVAAGRISYMYGLRGPCVAIDTACSSGLVAIAQAHNALMLGVTSTAVAAAVNLLLSPHTHAMYSIAGMLAADGRCKTLDAAAEGYVRAEGVGAAWLRCLRSIAGATLGNGRPAAVVLHGCALNQDGRSSSLTAPNGPAQQSLIRSALQAAHMPPSKVNALHLHGTGTPLGDPIEMGAAAAVLLAKSGNTV
ncbi:probable phthiocerol synthesis polyketide synthase type I PpsA at C-terminar half [Coccomyxa sp. Obi]|nr:probable phthiocerol synthesis polyketide synthase type I PpsA at C-terminar half [Coccomyxa sp. Obi]